MARLMVGASLDGQRLDLALSSSAEFGRSRSFAQDMIDRGLVLLNGRVPKASSRVHTGDAIDFEMPASLPAVPEPQSIPLDVVYEDEDIIVVNKARGMVVHPAAGNRSGTLVNALLARFPDLEAIGDKIRPGIVHRLDKDTTGLLVVARNEQALKHLQEQIKARQARRTYVALVWGQPPARGAVDAPIGRDPRNRKRMAVVSSGRPARTTYEVIERFEKHTLLRVTLDTGRTHQIRVHMSHIGHPVVGDPVYGRRKDRLDMDGQALHAAELRIQHPRTHVPMVFSAPLRDGFEAVLAQLRRSSSP
ncbi:MAG: RluA family pseudouridine synthase [Bacillota bacterium]|nr:RluA family pseudouridine synthase [Bacillota bacterium]